MQPNFQLKKLLILFIHFINALHFDDIIFCNFFFNFFVNSYIYFDDIIFSLIFSLIFLLISVILNVILAFIDAGFFVYNYYNISRDSMR